MRAVLDWLTTRPVVNGVVLLVYFLFCLFFHDWVQQPFYWGVAAMGHGQWNLLMAGLLTLFLLVVGYWFYRNQSAHPEQNKLLLYWSITLLLILLCFFVLIPYNSEVIHFPQYAVMTILLFPLVGRYVPALVAGVLLGVIDEAYQFFVLFTDRLNYLDFNDMLLNLVGASLGLMVVYTVKGSSSWHEKSKLSPRKMLQRTLLSPPYLVAIGLVVLGTALYASGVFGYFNDSGALIPLYRNPESNFHTTFWLITDFGARWHLVEPRQGIALLLLIPLLYMGLDKNNAS